MTIFHGIFTGGHSDGHFKTVGTEGGWRPSSYGYGYGYGYGYNDHDNDEEKQYDRPSKEAAEDGRVGYGVGGRAVASSRRGKGRGVEEGGLLGL